MEPEQEEISPPDQPSLRPSYRDLNRILISLAILFLILLLLATGFLYRRTGSRVVTEPLNPMPLQPQEPIPTTALQPAEEPPSKLNNGNIVNVVSLAYFPVKSNRLDLTIANNNWGEYGMSLPEVQRKVTRLNQGLEETLEEGSKHRGYQDTKAPFALDYVVLEKREFLEPVPISTKTSPYDPELQMTDYNKIVEDNDLCTLVNDKDVREIWLWSYTGIGKSGWESNFQSEWGDISNSDRDPNDLPQCEHSYTLYEYNYGREVAEATEDHIHQFEAIFNYVDRSLFWNEFVGYFPGRAESIENTSRRCGWAHFPPNGEKDYDWDNKTITETDCLNWQPGGDQTKSFINCTQWNCNGKDFFIFWMQSLPPSWWDFVSDFDAAKTRGQPLSQITTE